MDYWGSGGAPTALLIAGLLGLAGLLRHRIAPLRRLGIPGGILAGLLGLLLGPDLAGLLPLDREFLESVAYHGLALVFIAIALQSPPRPVGGRRSRGVVSMAFSIPFLSVSQGVIGLLAVLVLGLLAGEALHPGLGLLLPLGFEQGPGQALSMGKAWEASGLGDGAQLGLIIAAAGFAWAVLVGIPLVAWGRARGLVSAPLARAERAASSEEAGLLPPGSLDRLSRQAVAIGLVYLATWAVIHGAARLLAGAPEIAALLFGFHYIIGALLALAMRGALDRVARNSTAQASPLSDELLGRTAGLAVDVLTCAALAAIQISVLSEHWMAIAVLTTLGGLSTLLLSLWIARRAFAEAPFEHAVVLFGMGTGTLPMGLALLRGMDPELRSPAPANVVLGSAGALALGAPILLLIQLPINGWPDLGPSWVAAGLFTLYLGLLLLGWRRVGALSFTRPLTSLWPPTAPREPSR